MQLVLIKNRVIAYGGEYIAMGNTVVDARSGKLFSGATIAECNSCPPDIGEVGYEYMAGVFTPCAPYGKGDGNLAVLCNRDCKSIKDSDIPLSQICRTVKTTYLGTGSQSETNPCNMTFDFPPVLVFMMPRSSSVINYAGYLFGNAGFTFKRNGSDFDSLDAIIEGNTISWYGTTDASKCLNVEGLTYDVFAIGLKGE